MLLISNSRPVGVAPDHSGKQFFKSQREALHPSSSWKLLQAPCSQEPEGGRHGPATAPRRLHVAREKFSKTVHKHVQANRELVFAKADQVLKVKDGTASKQSEAAGEGGRHKSPAEGRRGRPRAVTWNGWGSGASDVQAKSGP